MGFRPGRGWPAIERGDRVDTDEQRGAWGLLRSLAKSGETARAFVLALENARSEGDHLDVRVAAEDLMEFLDYSGSTAWKAGPIGKLLRGLIERGDPRPRQRERRE